MTLNEFLSNGKREIFEELKAGKEPSSGVFDRSLMDSVRKSNGVQIGSTVLEPDGVSFEFLVLEDDGQVVFTVRREPPQRIVYLPIPEWVVEKVWQGEVEGSYHFESDAMRLIDEFKQKASALENARLFHERHVVGRT